MTERVKELVFNFLRKNVERSETGEFNKEEGMT